MIKGDSSLKGKNIQLQGLSGFGWVALSKASSYLELDAISDFMQPEYEYLIFFNGLNKASSLPDKSIFDLNDIVENNLTYCLDGIAFSYLKLDSMQENILQEKDTYSYKDIKNTEIFTTSLECLEVWNEIKEVIIGKFMP